MTLNFEVSHQLAFNSAPASYSSKSVHASVPELKFVLIELLFGIRLDAAVWIRLELDVSNIALSHLHKRCRNLSSIQDSFGD